MRHPSRRHPPVVFGDGGASEHAPSHSTAAFELALMLGATGLSARCHLSADGAVLLSDTASVGRWPRRRRLSDVARAEVPALPSLDDVLDLLDDEALVSIQATDDAAAAAVVDVLSLRGALGRLWLTHHDHETLARWRERWSSDPVLVHRGRIGALDGGPERHASRLAERRIDGLSMPAADWTGGLTTLVHRFELDAIASDARVERVFVDLVRMGIDAIHTGNIEPAVDVVAQEAGG